VRVEILCGHGGSRLRSVLYTVFALLLAITASSCKKRIDAGIEGRKDYSETEYGRLGVSARFPRDTDEIERIFKRSLPDSGIVPVYLTITNNDTVSMRIHTSHGLGLGGYFEGFTMLAGGKSYHPIRPVEVMSKATGKKSPVRYSKPGGKQIALGVLFFPYGGYVAYREASLGRYYRPLCENSIFPAGEGGMFDPVEIDPGESVDGYLYFELPRDQNPYPERSYSPEAAGHPDLFELVVRAVVDSAEAAVCRGKLAVRDSLPFDHISFTRIDGRFYDETGHTGLTVLEEDGDKVCPGWFFALEDARGSAGRRNLVMGDILSVVEGAAPADHERICEVRSKHAVVADAVAAEGYVACALNFKAKSKVMLFRCTGSTVKPAGEKGYSRNISSVHLSAGGLFATTTNGFCHFTPYTDFDAERRENMGRNYKDMTLIGDRLYAVHSRRLLVYGTSEGRLFEDLGSYDLPVARRNMVGFVGNRLILINGSWKSAGDTLVALDMDDATRDLVMPLPGRIALASTAKGCVIVQMEDGTVLEVRMCGSGASPTIVGAAYLPFEASSMLSCGGNLIAADARGRVAWGELETLPPESIRSHDGSGHSILEASTEVHLPSASAGNGGE